MKLKELSQILEGIVKSESSYIDYKVNCNLLPEHTLEIQFERMYEYVDISFGHLEQISEILGTKNINIGEREGHGGCETCDHGSRYIVPIYVKQYQLHLEK